MIRNTILTMIVAAWVTTSAGAQQWAEKMFKDGLKHDFGTVARGGQLRHVFTITNIYAVRMEITSVKSGCGCATATPTKRVLEPRESTSIEVLMDTRRFMGQKTVGIRVTVGPEYISSAELRISANCRSDVVFNPGQVTFGAVMLGQTPTQQIDVEYAGKVAWQVTEIIAKDIPYTVTFKEKYRQPGRIGYTLFVTLKPDAPLGTHRHELFLKTNDSANLVPVLVEATVHSAISVTPETLSLGAVKIDAPHVRRVVVRGTRPFRITNVEGMGSGIDLGQPLSDRDEQVQFVTFKVQPSSAGPFRRELKLKTTLQEVPLTVTIEGTASK
jgi:hypothetical protein